MVQRAAVVGLGLIGGSIGAALRQTGVSVHGFDTDPERAARARALGLVDEVLENIDAAVSNAEMVVIATPVLAVVDLLPRILTTATKAALIVDTASVKRPVTHSIDRLKRPVHALGGHPMAGKEQSGPEAADPALFRGRLFVFCPSANTTDQARDMARSLAAMLGSRPLFLDAEEHDRLVAASSHMPQLLSTALASYLDPESLAVAGPGLVDMTRLALSDTSMWRDIFVTNSDNVAAVTRGYIRRLEELIEIVDSQNIESIAQMMEAGRAAAESIRVASIP
jgi:prephenate dehydrogenase